MSNELTPEFDPPHTACPICRSERILPFKIDYQGIKIARCTRCRTEFMNPVYTDAYLAAFYENYQRNLTKTHKFGEDTRPRELIHHYNLEQIEGYRSPGRFLSVGCGKAVDVMVAKERGWDAEGFDVDAEYVAKRSAELGLTLRSGDFTTIDYDDLSFDCIYLNHVLEHPKNPGDYLVTILRILKPGGVLYIACPNIYSLSHRIKNLQEALHLRKNVAKHYDTWQHLFYYCPKRLTHALESFFEFKVVYTGSDIKARPGEDQVRVSKLADLSLKSTFRLIAIRNQK